MENNKGKTEPKRIKQNSHLPCTSSNFDAMGDLLRKMLPQHQKNKQPD